MKDRDIYKVIELLEEEFSQWKVPIVTEIAQAERSPFKVLISTVLSLRTKDETTREASMRLFALAETPADMSNLSPEQIEKAIYPAGFYKSKARNILKICRKLVDAYHSEVPEELEQLLEFPGVGRKTANLVLTLGHGLPGICVDTHVHRITNRLGYVNTGTPEETEFALRRKLPKQFWVPINDLLVSYGQNLCRPVSPYCSRCRIFRYCDRSGVDKSR
ncbi:MAG: endonuclease III domain-containing protein [bacterium]